MGTFQQIVDTLPTDPNLKGGAFESLVYWYLTNGPEYKPLVEKVWLWDDWPGRWAADAGIDLVVKTRHGALWAVQAKAYSAEYSITKRDVDSFLSESSRSVFAARMLITTTDRIGNTASRTLNDQEKQTMTVLLSDLDSSPIDWPQTINDLRPATIIRATPRPHQSEAIIAVLDGFKTHNRGKLIMACGTGKTYAGLWLHEDLKSQLTLVLVPSLSLMKQTIREWTMHRNLEFDYLAICSDETVGRYERSDSFVPSVNSIGVPVTTAKADIGRFLEASGRRVVFCTYQSSPTLASAMSSTPDSRFDLAIADEAHRCAGISTSAFATILSDSSIPAQKRLFMTATPRFIKGGLSSKSIDSDLNVVSMDNRSYFGPTFHSLTFAKSIEMGLLTDYQVVVVGIDKASDLRIAKRGDQVLIDDNRLTDGHSLASEIGLAKAMERYDLKRVLTFHSRVKHAANFAEQFPNVVEWMANSGVSSERVTGQYVSGKMNAGDRELRLKQLRTLDGTDRMVLSSARCLAEGVDVADIDGVAFIDPRRSQVDVIQAVGRALRLSSNKKIATVVIPVFIGGDEDAENAVKSSVFEPVWQVIKALRSHDQSIGDWLDNLRLNRGKEGTKITAENLPYRIRIELPIALEAKFADSFATRLVEMVTSPWEEGFGHLQKYVALHGTTRAIKSYFDQEDGFPLGNWILRQRQQRNIMSHDRKLKLDSLGFVWNEMELRWPENFQRLKDYVESHGNARVPGSYIVPTVGFKLGRWVNMQRDRNASLDEEQRQLLDSVGFVWNEMDFRWDDGFDHLKKYFSSHENANVPYVYVDPGDQYPLGRWVASQRKNPHRLVGDRRSRLERLDFNWGDQDRRWIEGFNHLETYVVNYGNADVPTTFVDPDDQFNLGSWVSNQRQYAKSSKSPLSDERRQRLESLGFIWSVNDHSWNEGIDHLKKFIQVNKTGFVPTKFIDPDDGFQLGSWAMTWRGRPERMSKKHRKQLDSMGFVWNALEMKWDEAFRRLEEYISEHGNADVQRRYVDPDDGFRLGQWVQINRSAKYLTPDRRKKLAAIGVKWESDILNQQLPFDIG